MYYAVRQEMHLRFVSMLRFTIKRTFKKKEQMELSLIIKKVKSSRFSSENESHMYAYIYTLPAGIKCPIGYIFYPPIFLSPFMVLAYTGLGFRILYICKGNCNHAIKYPEGQNSLWHQPMHFIHSRVLNRENLFTVIITCQNSS